MSSTRLLKLVADVQVAVGAVALIASMFLPWFSFVYEGLRRGETDTVTYVLWERYEVYAGVIVIAAAAALGLALLSIFRSRKEPSPESQMRLSQVMLLAALTAALMTWWKTRFPHLQITFDLLEMRREWGLWVGTLSALLLVDGAFMKLLFVWIVQRRQHKGGSTVVTGS